MDNTEKEQTNFEFLKNNHSSDYKFLMQRLKSISERIYLLEKNFLDKEK